MSMPQIPEHKYRPNIRCTIIDLLESIALEEMALSHLLNAEAEKIQVFVGHKGELPLCSNAKEAIEFSRVTSDFMEKIIMKQWLLLTKLNKIKEIGDICFFNEITREKNDVGQDKKSEPEKKEEEKSPSSFNSTPRVRLYCTTFQKNQ